MSEYPTPMFGFPTIHIYLSSINLG